VSSHSSFPLVVIGAGICGLTIARKHPHLPSLIIEKSRGLGGRIATRREGELVFDHGAQFFKQSKDQVFYWSNFLESKAVVHEWFSQSDDRFFCSSFGLTQIAKSLALGLNISLNEKVIAIEDLGKQVLVRTESGNSFSCERLVITSPLPQALELLSASKIDYPNELQQIKYAKALVGLFEFAKPLNIQFQEINRFGIYAVSAQKSKGLCLKEAFVVSMDPISSEKNFELSDELNLSLIIQSLLQVEEFSLGPKDILYSSLKKWKYSRPLNSLPSKSLNHALLEGRLILAGDAFGGGSIQGAVRSGLSIELAPEPEK